MVKAMSVSDSASAKKLYTQVRESSLYDQKLKMYKVNTSLEALPMDIGRARAFTPGGSKRIHLASYGTTVFWRYCAQEFTRIFLMILKPPWIPFLDPKIYGPQAHANSSFLVSSVHPG